MNIVRGILILVVDTPYESIGDYKVFAKEVWESLDLNLGEGDAGDTLAGWKVEALEKNVNRSKVTLKIIA